MLTLNEAVVSDTAKTDKKDDQKKLPPVDEIYLNSGLYTTQIFQNMLNFLKIAIGFLPQENQTCYNLKQLLEQLKLEYDQKSSKATPPDANVFLKFQFYLELIFGLRAVDLVKDMKILEQQLKQIEPLCSDGADNYSIDYLEVYLFKTKILKHLHPINYYLGIDDFSKFEGLFQEINADSKQSTQNDLREKVLDLTKPLDEIILHLTHKLYILYQKLMEKWLMQISNDAEQKIVNNIIVEISELIEEIINQHPGISKLFPKLTQIALVDPMGVYGNDAIKTFSTSGRTDLGGQIVAVQDFADEIQAFKIPTGTLESTIFSQGQANQSELLNSYSFDKVSGTFETKYGVFPYLSGDFAKQTEKQNSGVLITRFGLYTKKPELNFDKAAIGDGKQGFFTYPDVNSRQLEKYEFPDNVYGINIFWENLVHFAQLCVSQWLSDGKIPSIIYLPYASSAYLGPIILSFLEKQGVKTEFISFVFQPHSLGEAKILNQVEVSFLNLNLGDNLETNFRQMCDCLISILKKPQTLYPLRLLSERLIPLSIVNGSEEKQRLFAEDGFYQTDFVVKLGNLSFEFPKPQKAITTLPPLSPYFKIKSEVEPGQQSNDFYDTQSEMTQIIGSFKDPTKPVLLLASRWSSDKGILEMINYFCLYLYSEYNLLVLNEDPGLEQPKTEMGMFIKQLLCSQTELGGTIRFMKKPNSEKLALIGQVAGVYNKIYIDDLKNSESAGKSNTRLYGLKPPIIYVGTSPYEPFGLTLPEMVATGTVGVCTEGYNSGAEVFGTDNEAIKTFNWENPESLKTALSDTLKDFESLRERQLYMIEKYKNNTVQGRLRPLLLECFKSGIDKSLGLNTKVRLSAEMERSKFKGNEITLGTSDMFRLVYGWLLKTLRPRMIELLGIEDNPTSVENLNQLISEELCKNNIVLDHKTVVLELLSTE